MKRCCVALSGSISRQAFIIVILLISGALLGHPSELFAAVGQTLFDEAIYNQIRTDIQGESGELDDEFQAIITSNDFMDGAIDDDGRTRSLIFAMDGVFSFIQQLDNNVYVVPEELKGEFSYLQHLCFERLLPLTRLLVMRFYDPQPTVQFLWGLGKGVEKANFYPNPGIFDAIGILDLPYNYTAMRSAISQANLQLADALATDPSRLTECYNDWIVLYRQAVDLKQFVIGLTPKVPIGNTDTDIALLEKRALYKGMQSFKNMAEGSYRDGVYGEILKQSVMGQVFGGLAAIIQGIKSIDELFDLMGTELLHCLDVGIQIATDEYGPEDKVGYTSWPSVTVGNIDGLQLRAWIPNLRKNEIDSIETLITAIEANLASIAGYPTVLDKTDEIDWISITPAAYLAYDSEDDTLASQLTFQDGVAGPELQIPENRRVTYRLTFPGLMAQPAFWRNAETMEIHVNGNFPEGIWIGPWDGLGIKKSVTRINNSGFVISETHFDLEEGEQTATGYKWKIDLQPENGYGTGMPWAPDDPENWILPWEETYEYGGTDQYVYHHLHITIEGADDVFVSGIDVRMFPESHYLSGSVTDTGGTPVQDDIAFVHLLDNGAGIQVLNDTDENGDYFVSLPAMGETDYRIQVGDRICGIEPDIATVPAENDRLDISVNLLSNTAIVVEDPIFQAGALPEDPIVAVSDAAQIDLSGYAQSDCSDPLLQFTDYSNGGALQPIALPANPVNGTQYPFTYTIEPDFSNGPYEFILKLGTNSGEQAVYERFEIHPPTLGVPEVILGSGYDTFALPRLEEIGSTYTFSLLLKNIGTETPEIVYLSLSASTGMDIIQVQSGGMTAGIDASASGEQGVVNGYTVSNYPPGSDIYNTSGEIIAAVQQLVDIRGENRPSVVTTHVFEITVQANAAAIGMAQWIQYRAAFKTSEQDPADYQSLFPSWPDTPFTDQQDFPAVRIEAPYDPPATDQFPNDPAASIDSDGDGYPDFWDSTATAAEIAASNLEIDAFPSDPAKWAFELDASGSVDIVAAEYFFDTDPGTGRGTAFAPADTVFSSPVEYFERFNVSTKGLEPGVHRVFVRVKDANNQWSSLQSASFEVKAPTYGNNPVPVDQADTYWTDIETLSRGECFFGADPGVGLGIPFTTTDGTYDQASEMFDVSVVVPENICRNGTCTVSIRVQDARGVWSPVRTAEFELDSDMDGMSDGADAFPDDPAASMDRDHDGYPDGWNENATDAQIAASVLCIDAYPSDPSRFRFPPDLMIAEYFIDEDPGYGNGYPLLSADGVFDHPFEMFNVYNVSTTGLNPGVHTVYVRVRDGDGVWSPLRSACFEIKAPVYGNQSNVALRDSFWATPELLIAGEYFFGEDPGEGNGTAFQPTDDFYDQVSETFDLDIAVPEDVGPDMDTVSVRVQDAAGTWSSVRSVIIVLDADQDGIGNFSDNCPMVENPDQTDTDGDNIGDACDSCPNDAGNDQDQDGICGDTDNCPAVSNANQTDIDGDTIGDACDICPDDPNNDTDNDGICGDIDNCPTTSNSDQSDIDEDGIGDICDSCPEDSDNDADSDGVCGNVDNCPTISNSDQTDIDGDGIGDVCDICPNDPDNDIDGDSICGDVDNCPNVANENQEDTDNDGIGDACEDILHLPGDINGDGVVALDDLILVLQICADVETESPINITADADDDGKIGMAEIIYIFENISGLR